MSIAQRKDGRYCVKYKHNDKWQQRTFRSLAEAKKFEGETTIEEAIAEELSVGEVLVSYYRSIPHHKATVYHMKNCYFKPDGEGYFLFDRFTDTLTRRDLERLRENFRVRNVSNKTINNRTSMLKAALAWAFDQELIGSNPWKDYKRLPERKTPISVSMDKFKAIYDVAPAWLQWAMKTAFCLCLRFGRTELFDLKWSAFDFRTNSVTLNQGKSGILKTVFPPREYLDEAKLRYDEDRNKGIEFVCTRKGKHIKEYQYAWYRICRRIGVSMRPYDIRHLAATTMLANGADIVSVAAQLGHQNCALTGKVYAHAMVHGQQRAGQALTM